MKTLLLAASLAAAPALLAGQMTPSRAVTPRDSALHALNRLAYGPRPGDVEAVAQQGVMKWIDQQLDPNRIKNDALAQRERAFDILRENPSDLAQLYETARQERQQQKRALADTMAAAADATAEPPRVRRLTGEMPELAVVRAEFSERQLEEVMVDFWTNHFNVFANKGADRWLLPDYIEHTIRPHALGKFEDLLIATAQSPAMMFYLDNWESVVPGAVPPQILRARARGRSIPEKAMERLPKGINENYGRELMELHTLGVDGGYTQADVIAVARIFTGWSVDKPQRDPRFVFNDWAHDFGPKTALGMSFPSGHGMDEGIRLLKMLSMWHATMHHVSRELCERFVNDDPPDGCVDDAVLAWERSNGDIREVLRAIFHGPDFWASPNLGGKVKTPLEFLVSALRAVRGEPDSTLRLAQVVARLGEPLYQHVAPDGYPEKEEDWINGGALLNRMNVAVGLAAGRLPGVLTNLDDVVTPTADHSALVDAVNRRLLGGSMTAHTRQVIIDQINDVTDPTQARDLAVGFALGGPEFQRQ